MDVEAAHKRLEEIGWVASVRVDVLPDTIRVAIRERIPVAVWQNKGKFLLVDAEGVVIGSEGFERFKNLKIVIGKDAPKHAQALIAMLERQPSLMARVKAAVRSGNRRWNLRMDNGVDVQLPEKDPLAAWDRLAAYEKQHQLLDRDIGRIDLRLPGRVIVEVRRSKLRRRERQVAGHDGYGKKDKRTVAKFEHIAALDIGTTKVCCFIAEKDSGDRIQVTGIGYHASEGLKAGSIVDMQAAEQSVLAAVHAAEQMAGTTIREVIVNVSAGEPTSGFVDIDTELTSQAVGDRELGRLFNDQKLSNLAAQRHLVHAIPIGYEIDGSNGFATRLGCTAINLAYGCTL